MANTETEAPPRRWWILATIAIAQLMVALDSTVMNVALPSVQAELDFTDGSRTWIITAYTLAFGSLLLLSGRLADRFGRKNVFIIGLIGFAIASGVGGAADSFGMLVASRAVQGAFAALLAPAALSLLTTTFSGGRERARAFGIYASIGIGGSAIGLLLGGVLTEYLSWRWTMYINVIFALVAVAGAFVVLRSSHQVRATSRIDVPGAILVSAALFGIVFGISNAAEDGWDSPLTFGFLAGGVVLLAVFVVMQARIANPLLPLRVVLDRGRSAGLLGMFFAAAGMFAVVFFTVYYVQGVLGYTALQSGIAFLPLPLTLIATAVVIGPRLSRRFGPRLIVPVGLTISGISVLLMTRIGVDDNYALYLLPTLVLLGLGNGLAFPPSTSNSTLGVKPEDAGVASALVNTTQQVGGSISVAALNTIATTAATSFLVGKTVTPAVVADAAVHSYVIGYWWAAGLFFVGAIVVAALSRSGVPAGLRDPQPEPEAAIIDL